MSVWPVQAVGTPSSTTIASDSQTSLGNSTLMELLQILALLMWSFIICAWAALFVMTVSLFLSVIKD